MPRLLDLFCGAGGAAMGYHRAGFEVVGVDINPQPHYPFEFHQGDAMTWPLDGFDAIHASPPCQHYSAMTVVTGRREDHPDLIEPMRERLKGAGVPWIMENVPGSPLEAGVVLCGTGFGLRIATHDLRRHRYFELGFDALVMAPPCQHDRNRKSVAVYGHSGGTSKRAAQRFGGVAEWREAMDIDWMTMEETAQAIPPAYTEFLGGYLMAALQVAA